MPDRYIVFDVETPNFHNDRISSIGITVVEDGGITGSYCTLVDPQTHFDRYNIQLTGITPEMVRGKPNFPQLWEQIRPMMDSGILVAHNAPFDMGVLAKCLRAYNISWKPQAAYACTCAMGRRCYPALPNHKLNTMCAHLNIALCHHRADSDSTACAELLLDYMKKGLPIEAFVRTYHY